MSESLGAVVRRQIEAMLTSFTTDEQHRILDWVEQAIEERDDHDSIKFPLLMLIVEGHARITTVTPEIKFTLTEAGRDDALQILLDSAEARALYERVSGKPMIDPPRGKQ